MLFMLSIVVLARHDKYDGKWSRVGVSRLDDGPQDRQAMASARPMEISHSLLFQINFI